MRLLFILLLSTIFCYGATIAQSSFDETKIQLDEVTGQRFIQGEVLITFSSLEKSKQITETDGLVTAKDQRFSL